MSILNKIFGKYFTLLSIGIVIVLIMSLFTASVTAATPTGPFNLVYTADENGIITGAWSQTVELGGSGTAVEVFAYYGYHFVDWSDGSVDNPRIDTDVSGDISVVANFAINTYTLYYYASNGGTLTGTASQTVTHDDDGTSVWAVPDLGYLFVEWSDGETANPRTDNDVTADVEVSAIFAIETFSLDYAADSTGIIEGERWQTVEYGTDGTSVTAIPNTGYHFTNWSDDSTENPRTDYYVTADVEVTAFFDIDSLTLKYTAGANGSLTGNTSQTVGYDADGTEVNAIADEGYQFVNWSDGSTENPRTDYYVTANIDVTANFAFLYTVTFDSQGGSEVPDQLVVAGGKVDYPVAPATTGLYFAGWYKEAACENIWHTYVDLISGNATLYAKWNETAPKVAVLCADSTGTDIKAKLDSTGLFSQVDIISSLHEEIPTLFVLKQYNAVIIYSNASNIINPAELGDVLADYVDAGGGVVLAAFTFVDANGTIGIDGRISTEDYLIFTHKSFSYGDHLTLVADVVSDPILNGVNSFDGGSESYHCKVSTTSDANPIAHWSNDVPLVATKQLTAGRIVGLNFYPPSSDVRSDLWVSSADGDLLMANSLVWAASTGGTLSAPTITSDGGGDTASVYAEENQTTVTTVTATDSDSTTLTYSISGGFDAGKFTIDASSGVLTFMVTPDFEIPTNYYGDNIYEVTVQVSDGELSDSQHIQVTVTNAPNEAPTITSDGGNDTASIDTKEKQTTVTTVTAKDMDNDTLTYSISGGDDADQFTIDSSSGVLTFKAAPDFETKNDFDKDGTYEVTVEVSDGALTDTQVLSVNITLLTPVDLLNNLKSDIYHLQSEGKISRSTASGLVRTIHKAVDKINASDNAGAIKLLNSLKTSISRQTPKKIPTDSSGDLVVQIDQVIVRLNN